MIRLRGYSGLGNVPLPNYEDCGYPPDSACVLRNNNLGNEYQLARQLDLAQQNRQICLDNARSASSPAQLTNMLAECAAQFTQQTGPEAGDLAMPTRGGQIQPGSLGGGRVSFAGSRGGTDLQVGDTWLVSITGATGNAPVTMNGSGPGGPIGRTDMGTTDRNGNFSKSGTVRAAEIGPWSESWQVGNLDSGSFSFMVSGPAGAQPGAASSGGASSGSASSGGTPPLVTPPPTSLPVIPASGSASPAGGSPSAGASPAGGTVIGGFDLSKVPTWGWAAAAAVAFLAFGGRR